MTNTILCSNPKFEKPSYSQNLSQALDVLLLEAEARGVAADGLQEPDCARLITAAFEQGGARWPHVPQPSCHDMQWRL